MGPQGTDLPGLPGWPRDDSQTPARVESDTSVAPPPWAVPAISGEPTKETPRLATQQREPTLTQQIRAVQPPDVARQAIGELGVLAREIDALPEALIDSGLAKECFADYREALLDYVDLSHYAWEAVAEEQLEQAGAEPDYRQRAVRLARNITRLQQAASQARPGEGGRRGRIPLLMRRRVRLVRQGLVQWQTQLVPVPDPKAMGRALFLLQGYVSLAAAGTLALVLLDLTISLTLALTGLMTLGSVLLLLGALFVGATSSVVVPTVALALVSALAWGVALVLTTSPLLPLELLLGAIAYSRRHSASLGWEGSPVVAALLRVWWMVICALAVLSVPLGVALGGVLLASNEPFPVPVNAPQAINLIGGILYLALVLPAVASFVALIVLAAPFGLVAMIHSAREMAGNVYWVPKARRYNLGAALAVVVALTVLVAEGIEWVGSVFGWQHITIFSVSLGPLSGTLSVRGLVLIIAGALPFLLLFDLPYRIGIRNWRAQRLADLEKHRAELESQVRRLATQDANDDLLRAMQYDLVLLQFYKSQMDDANSTSAAPFRVEGRILATILAVVGGLLVDGLGGFVVHLMSAPR